MHIVNLLEHLLPELIPFILKELSNQDLKNCRSINDIWTKEVDLEWPKKKTLFDFVLCHWFKAKIQSRTFIRSWKSVTRVSAIVENSLNMHY